MFRRIMFFANLRSQERGYLESLYVDEGQFVKKGQLLFQIVLLYIWGDKLSEETPTTAFSALIGVLTNENV